jgi:hypothetical protein
MSKPYDEALKAIGTGQDNRPQKVFSVRKVAGLYGIMVQDVCCAYMPNEKKADHICGKLNDALEGGGI